MLPKSAVLGTLILSLFLQPRLAGAVASVESQLQDLAAQNQRLQAQVQEQQKMIEQLSTRLGDIERGGPAPEAAVAAPTSVGELRLSGEAGIAYFDSTGDGFSPNREFRVDDAKLFLDARIWKDAYLFAGMELTTREAADEYFHVGELYLDVENLSSLLGGRDSALNLRAGRFYIPFGEEYQMRGVADNPLITHSVSDIWGIDEGVEIYGSFGPVNYVAAVQNGGIKTMRDFDPDKSLAGRLAWSPLPWLRLSASAMRTGAVNNPGDFLSAVWFGGGFFRALSPPAVAPTFQSRLYEGDAIARWHSGSLLINGGHVLFADDGGERDSRRMSYYGAEAEQNVVGRLYAAARYSTIRAPRGYALSGVESMNEYFFGNSITDELRRLSVGLGYRFAQPLIWKTEYTIESRRTTAAQPREKVDMISSEVGVKF